MYRALIITALLVFGLALLGAILAPADRPAEPPAFTAATAPSASEPIIGFAVSLHYVDDIKPHLKSLEELAALGFNSVEIVTPAYQVHGASEEITFDDPDMAKPADVVAMLQKARSLGMGASLMPIVLLKDPRGNEWRGKISPENWDKWWASYMRFSAHFLDLANKGGATSFSVGSELLTTEEMTGRWDKVIAQARARFSGRLYYSTNWDHYWVPTFWKQLDMIGINAYWDLTKGTDMEHPDPVVLAKNWAKIREEVLSKTAGFGKPVLFTEVGFPSLNWGMKDPWNYVNDGTGRVAPEVQANGFRSFLAAWGDLLDRPWPPQAIGAEGSLPPRPGSTGRGQAASSGGGAGEGSSASTRPLGHPATSSAPRPMAGVYFYSWEPGGGDANDAGYGVRGKPTYDLLKQWLAAYAHPATPAP